MDDQRDVVMRFHSGWIVAASLLALCAPARAAELSGSARVYGAATDTDGLEADQLDQRYTLNLLQALTPWLSLAFSFRYADFETTGEGADFDRSSTDPRLELIYRRPTVDARLSFQDRRNRGSGPTDDLDLRSLLAQLRWRPRKGPSYELRWRDETNVADAAVFGRDVSSRYLSLQSIYDRQTWGARYAYQTTRLDNAATGLAFDEDRHQLRAHFDRQFAGDTVALSASSWISRREQREAAGAAAAPVAAREGLFAVDLTPGVGELDPVSGLIDGDLETPADPRIEIGGASTFRNVGVDLGLSRRVTRLEVSVDAPSSPDLAWEVYRSSDNLSWSRVAGVQSSWDGALARYTLRFPAADDRYFKAVNVTVNAFTGVAVTELRALLDVDRLGTEGRSTTYRGDVAATFTPHERVQANVTLGIGNDEDLAGGLVSRDLDELSYGARLGIELTPELTLRVGYHFTRVDERLEPVLERDERQWSATFDWTPLPTVDGVLAFSRRDERDGGTLIRSADTVRLRFLTELLTHLELTSEVTWSDIDDPFSGFRQEVWHWRESLAADLTERWSLQGSVALSFFDSTGTVTLERRSQVDVRTAWRPAAYLSLAGDWGWTEDDLQETLTQRYSASWTPGRKLQASLSYQETDSSGVRRTTTLGGNVSYRLRPQLVPYATLSRSTFSEVGDAPTRNASLRVGFNLFF